MPRRPRFTIPLVGLVLLAAAVLLTGCGNDKWTARDVPSRYSTIQAAVNAAEPGDLVRIAPGDYHEQVTVPPSKRDIVIRGVNRNRVVLDGDNGGSANGIVVHANGVAVENLTVRGYAGSAVLFTPPANAKDPLEGWRAQYITAADNGSHGIDAVGARGGTIEHVWASGHGQAGMRISNCEPCDLLVTDNVAERNNVGLEATNAGGNIVVVHSVFRDNRVGVLLTSSESDESFHQQDGAVVGNVIADNSNRRAPGDGDDFGVGLLVRGGRRDGLARNRITGHVGAGLMITASEDTPSLENNVQGNLLRDNRVDLVLWPGNGQRSSRGSCFAQNRFSTSLPPGIEKLLPCQADVPVHVNESPLPKPPPGVDWRTVALPGAQRSMPQARAAKPQPARSPRRIDVAKVGVPGEG
jgi:hypothetical protein